MNRGETAQRGEWVVAGGEWQDNPEEGGGRSKTAQRKVGGGEGRDILEEGRGNYAWLQIWGQPLVKNDDGSPCCSSSCNSDPLT